MQYEKEFLRKLYRNLLDMRLLEQKMVDTYAQGRVPGHIHSGGSIIRGGGPFPRRAKKAFDSGRKILQNEFIELIP